MAKDLKKDVDSKATTSNPFGGDKAAPAGKAPENKVDVVKPTEADQKIDDVPGNKKLEPGDKVAPKPAGAKDIQELPEGNPVTEVVDEVSWRQRELAAARENLGTRVKDIG